jgi:error-prone DNA polymerase
MGFWSPHTLVQDARRHGVVVRTPDLNASLDTATLEPCEGSSGGFAVRLGYGSVRGIGATLAAEVAAGRPYSSPEDLVRRVPALTLPQLEALATAGVFTECFGLERREALWAMGAVAQSRPGRLAGLATGVAAPPLPGMGPVELAVADLWATGVAPDGHPTRFLRADLDRRGALSAVELRTRTDGEKVLVAGVVTHRQRPATAAGVTFMNLEDETGLINVVVSRGCWQRYRHVAGSAPALLVSGRLERSVDDVVNVVATRIELLPVVATVPSRDFR